MTIRDELAWFIYSVKPQLHRVGAEGLTDAVLAKYEVVKPPPPDEDYGDTKVWEGGVERVRTFHGTVTLVGDYEYEHTPREVRLYADLGKAAWYLRDMMDNNLDNLVWTSLDSRERGRRMIAAHVEPRITGDLLVYRPLLYISSHWLDHALLDVTNQIATYCDCCDGRGHTGPSHYQAGINNECPECEGSGLRVDQDRNMA